jgi:hypothetical protein
MSQQEAVRLLSNFEDADSLYSDVSTRDGTSMSRAHFFDNYKELPPPEKIERGVLTVLANDGQEMEVTLGRGGVVTGKRLVPSELSLECWLRRGRRAEKRIRTLKGWGRGWCRATGV